MENCLEFADSSQKEQITYSVEQFKTRDTDTYFQKYIVDNHHGIRFVIGYLEKYDDPAECVYSISMMIYGEEGRHQQLIAAYGGSSFMGAIGYNIPADEDFKRRFGTKTLIFPNINDAYFKKFVPVKEMYADRIYDDIKKGCAEFMLKYITLHETLGHASNTIENLTLNEMYADLVAIGKITEEENIPALTFIATNSFILARKFLGQIKGRHLAWARLMIWINLHKKGCFEIDDDDRIIMEKKHIVQLIKSVEELKNETLKGNVEILDDINYMVGEKTVEKLLAKIPAILLRTPIFVPHV